MSAGTEANPLVARFFASKLHRPLLAPPFHALANYKHLAKELSESVAACDALEDLAGPTLKHWHVIDLCCGAGLTAATAALRWPGCRVTAVVTAVDRISHKMAAGRKLGFYSNSR